MRLSELKKGNGGFICGIEPGKKGDLSHEELERRLLEMGFVEGARFRILQEGLVGRDPIALQLDDMRVALRRAEAQSILVEREASVF